MYKDLNLFPKKKKNKKKTHDFPSLIQLIQA